MVVVVAVVVVVVVVVGVVLVVVARAHRGIKQGTSGGSMVVSQPEARNEVTDDVY